jgi:hypothetical protein
VLIAWTVSELAIALTLDGRVQEARDVLEIGSLPPTLDGPGDRTALLWARAYVALAEGDLDAARSHAMEALRIDRDRGAERALAITTWWVGSLFGADAAGGQEELERARKILESVGWVRAFHELEQVRGTLVPVRERA